MMAEQVVLWSDKFQIMLLKLFSSLDPIIELHLEVLLKVGGACRALRTRTQQPYLNLAR